MAGSPSGAEDPRRAAAARQRQALDPAASVWV